MNKKRRKRLKRQKQRYQVYRKLADTIHAHTCDDRDWCNYGEPETASLADDVELPPEERQRRAGERLRETRHCRGAVDAENLAAELIRTARGK